VIWRGLNEIVDGESEVLHISPDGSPHFAVKPLKANAIDVDACLAAGVCEIGAQLLASR
jgi:hypothetical protein